MTLEDQSRDRFIRTLDQMQPASRRRLLAIELDDEIIELKRVAVEIQFFEVAADIRDIIEHRGLP